MDMGKQDKIIKLDVISSLNEMEKLKFEWDKVLYNYSNSTPFQSWEWNYGIAKTYNSGESLRIIIGRNQGGDIVGIAPFKLRKHSIPGMLVLEFIGTGPSDYLDIIFIGEYRDAFIEELFNCKIYSIEFF